MLSSYYPQPNAHANVPDMPAWQPDPQERVLILAPHPDDETLAVGGLIASMTSGHASPHIRVIVATNGDASYLTAITAGGRRAFTRRNFQNLAAVRQQESMNALTSLGLDSEQIRFWGFPDRGLGAIWRRYWGANRPYRSPTTGYRRAKQAVNSPVLPFTGASLIELFQNELGEFQPTTVILPHPQDAHPDHRFLAYFTLFSIALHQKRAAHAPPKLLAFQMWQNKFQIKEAGAALAGYLFGSDASPKRQYLPFSSDIREQKAQALQCYASQKWAAGPLLRKATRNDYEVFSLLQPDSFGIEQPGALRPAPTQLVVPSPIC